MQKTILSVYRKLANYLTTLRFIIVIPIIISLENSNLYATWLLIFLAALSDYLDGWFGKKSDGGTKWGARMDPLADKLIIVSPLIWLSLNSVIPFWAACLLIIREIIITNIRSEDVYGLPASLQGKVKTILQYAFLLLLLNPLIGGNIDSILYKSGLYLFWCSFIISLLSGGLYIRQKSSLLLPEN